MAATVSTNFIRSKSNYLISITDVDLGTYTTGGVTVTPADLGIEKVHHAVVDTGPFSGTISTEAVNFAYDYTTNKILAYTSTNEELAGAVVLTNLPLRVIAFKFG